MRVLSFVYMSDYGYSAMFAKQCHDAKIPRAHLVTAMGSNKDSFFLYPEVKGKLEELYVLTRLLLPK
jgi:hypothetical protein